MPDPSPLERAKSNATEIASTVVTGVWLAALFLEFDWWLPFMLFGYVVIVPVVSLLFDDEETEPVAGSEGRLGEAAGTETADRSAGVDSGDPNGTLREGTAAAIDRLRTRYAEGDLTDEQFERKLDELLETETPEDAAEWRNPERERSFDRDRS